MAALISQPVKLVAGRPIVAPHQALYAAAVSVSGLTFGLLIGAAMVSLALYALTRDLDPVAWRYMLISVPTIVAITVVAYPTFVGHMPASGSEPTSLAVFSRAIISLHVWAQTLFGACAGYWLAGTGADQMTSLAPSPE